MFTRSHLQEMKRRYALMYAPLIEEKFEEHCGVCGEQGIEEVEVDEAPKGTPKPKVEKGRGGYQVMVWSPSSKKYIPQGQPHRNEKDAEKDAKSFEEVEVAESFELQATMALDDVGIKSKWKKGKLYVAKRDIKKAEKALGKSFKKMKKGAEPDLYYEEKEEVEIEEGKLNYHKKMVAQHNQYAHSHGVERGNSDEDGEHENDHSDAEDGHEEASDAHASCIAIAKKFGEKSPEFKKAAKEAYKASKEVLDFDIEWRYIDRKPAKKVMRIQREEVELDEKGTAYPATVDTLRKIVKDKQHQTVMFKSGQALVDLFTASAMVQVYDALKKPDMKKTFEKMIADKAGFMKTQAFAMKMIGK